jgi:hypothetical protein
MSDPNSYYDDAGAAPAPADAPPQSGAARTATLNKEVLGGQDVQVGQEITLRVTAVHGQELLVESVGADEEQTEPAPEQAAEPAAESGDENYA